MTRLRTLRRSAVREKALKLTDLQRTTEWEAKLAAEAERNKIQVQKAGGFVKARYKGRRTFVLAFDERQALERLKTWDNGGTRERTT
jgi:hypothetical protein